MEMQELIQKIKFARYTRFYQYGYNAECVAKAKSIFNNIAEAYGMQYIEPKELDIVVEYIFNPKFKNREKGFMLIGSTGVGKTMLMQMFMDFISLYPLKFFHGGQVIDVTMRKRTAQEIAEYYKHNGEIEEMLEKSILLWIDDLGSEIIVSRYGVKHNPVEELLVKRYEKGLYTFSTTNVSKFSEIYNDRTISRMNAMFTPILMSNKNDFRKM